MFSAKLPQGLYRRLAAYSVLIAFSLGLILSLYQIYNDYKRQDSRLEQDIKELVTMVKPSAEKAIYEFDEKLGKLVLDTLFDHPAVLSVIIRDDYGDNFQQESRRVMEKRPSWLPEKFAFYPESFVYPLNVRSDNKSNLATLSLVVDPYVAIGDFISRAGLILITGIVRNILLAFVLLVISYHLVTKPINRLAQGLISVDPFSEKENRLEVSTANQKNEIGSLANMINNLLERIQSSFLNIQKLNKELNNQVTERIQIEQAIHYAERETAGATGSDYIKAIAHFLGSSLELDGVSIFKFENSSHPPRFISLVNSYEKLEQQPCTIELRKLSFLKLEEGREYYSLTSEEAKCNKLFNDLNSIIIPLSDYKKGLIGLLVLSKTREFDRYFFSLHKSLLQIFSSRLQTEIERENQEQTIRKLAHTDTLTGLANRYYFHYHLSEIIDNNKRHKQRYALLYLDLNRFKWVNDSFGHGVGDKLLVQVSQRIKEVIRESDLLARIGGDEFAIFIEVNRDGDEYKVAQKIHTAFNTPFTISNHIIATQTSIGISIYPDSAQTTQDLLKNADMAMYMAKKEPENGIHYYSESVNKKIQRKILLENELSKAISQSSLEIAYQPLFSVADGSIKSLEALLRWNHPQYGSISPVEFVPIAEETGLIHQLGNWVLANACKQVMQWNQVSDTPIKVAVNFSAYQLRSPLLVPNFIKTLKKYHTDPTLIELEITETALIEDVKVTANLLKQLAELGVHISIDDFGTGYSSLNFLKLLPINTLKIDKSFTAGIPDQPSDLNIVKATIALAKAMNMTVIAEGVETKQQEAFLAKQQCDLVQGYYYAKPMPADKVTQMLKEKYQVTINSPLVKVF